MFKRGRTLTLKRLVVCQYGLKLLVLRKYLLTYFLRTIRPASARVRGSRAP